MSRVVGKVKWFDAQKGFGFIVNPDPTAKDIFVHFSHIQMEGYKTLKEAQQVEYTMAVIEGKPQAHDVKII